MKTYDSTYVGWTSISRATLRSDNSVYAQLTVDVTPARVAAMARKLGVRTPLDVNGAYVPAMGLGSIAVSPLDMASAYATLAAGGIYSTPTAIRKVVLPGGKVDTDAKWGVPKRKRVISDGVASVVTDILQDNVLYGTGTRAGFGRPAAGKTGTTDEHADAWFVGYTPQLATAVWMGYTRGEIPMLSVHGIAVSGGSFPAEIWRLYMEPALAALPVRDFPAPVNPVTYEPWHRGPFVLTYDPNPPATSTDTTDTEKGDTTKAPTKPSPSHTPDDPTPACGSASAANGTALASAANVTASTSARNPATARRRRHSPAPRRIARVRARRLALLGAGIAATVAAASALAWRDGSGLVPRDGGLADARPERLFLALLALAFAAYVVAMLAARSATLRLRSAIVIAVIVQALPLGAPLLLSTDAWTYWGYGWIAAEGDGNPYRDPPSSRPESPALPHLGAAWRDTTTVYGPAFTAASEAVAGAAGGRTIGLRGRSSCWRRSR